MSLPHGKEKDTPQRQPFEPELVHVPAGPFLMGTSDRQIERLAQDLQEAQKWKTRGYFSREQPQHTVTLPDYYIGKYPVTVGQYRAFIDAGGYAQRRHWTGAGWVWRTAASVVAPALWNDARWSGDDRLPVVGVSWYEAYAYCRWLRALTGHDYRLPTEAEWEKAARGTDGRRYPWGETFDAARANTRASRLNRTTPVEHYSPAGDSPYGCADMAGNVSQWALSQYRPYPYVPDDGRDDPEGADARVIRGGAWFKPVIRARAAARGMNDPFFRDNDVGLRCACDVRARPSTSEA